MGLVGYIYVVQVLFGMGWLLTQLIIIIMGFLKGFITEFGLMSKVLLVL